MAVISHNYGREAFNNRVPMYVHQCLIKSAYMLTYRGMIHPLLDQKRSPSTAETSSSQAADSNPTRKKKINLIYKFIVFGNYSLAII
ncbi:hypothetical protein Ddye_023189 [Dipteronia dyeriana]|uniref:Uncharacterized protein n=1 Tax=Dipteronia dyeriana TaxID=168575 RepID=A0AAD9TSM6_9ROSI|nr:hypothetical protein Ddye_023189 [Dipteronia dyeriana]